MPVYQLLLVSHKGEKLIDTFAASTLKEACERHIQEWNAKKFREPLVLVLEDDSRHSYTDSVEFLKEVNARTIGDAKLIALDALKFADDNATDTSKSFGYLWSALAMIANDPCRIPPWESVNTYSTRVQS